MGILLAGSSSRPSSKGAAGQDEAGAANVNEVVTAGRFLWDSMRSAIVVVAEP